MILVDLEAHIHFTFRVFRVFRGQNEYRASLTTLCSQRAAVLLEVLLALVLFVVAAAIITASMNASMEGVDRLKLNTHAGNLAVTVLAELQLGIRAADANGEETFEKPFEEWTCEVARTGAETESGESSGLTQVEVIIRRKNPDLVYRQAQLLKLEPAKAGARLTAANP